MPSIFENIVIVSEYIAISIADHNSTTGNDPIQENTRRKKLIWKNTEIKRQ